MTIFFIILTAAISIPAFMNRTMFDRMKFNAYIIRERREWYRFFSHGLIHADWGHLLINMFVLYSFGSNVEEYFYGYFGAKGYLYYFLMYAGGIFLSSVPSFEKHKHDIWYNAVGASGAVSAVLFSSIIFDPASKIVFMLLPFFPVPAALFGVLYLVYSAYMAKRATDNIGHDAHFWGALFGAGFTVALKPLLFLVFFRQLMNIF